MAVPVKTDPTFKPETPKILFRGRYVSFSTNIQTLELSPWDIDHEGKRFLMMKPFVSSGEAAAAAAAAPQRINIVLNWLEELKQRVPLK